MHIKAKNRWIKHLDFIITDLLCLNVTFLFAYFLRNRGISNMYARPDYRMIVIVAMILHFCIVFFSNYYSGILKRGYFKELKKVVIHNLELSGLLFAYMFITQAGSIYSRIVLISFFVMDTITMYLVHIILKFILRKKGQTRSGQIKVLLMTTTDLVEETLNEIMNGPDNTRTIEGIALEKNPEGIKEVQGIPVVVCGDEVYEYICRNVVDEVVISINLADTGKIEETTNKLLGMGITVHIKMDIFEKGIPNVYFGRINEANVMTTSINTVSLMDIALKRTFDICVGFVGCIVTAILYIFIAPAIKIADPKGPVFFGQVRAGKNGRPFKIYKFRSMYSDAEERKKELMDKNKMDGLMFKIDADPRIIGSGPDGTKKGLGHFLRATSLDEFPNFWSILKGDMSFVGTRPPTMDEYEKYELHHKSRLATKPGLTGMWQVSGRSDMTDFEDIVKLDNEYIRNWSVGLDLKIIFKTIWVVLTRKGSV